VSKKKKRNEDKEHRGQLRELPKLQLTCEDDEPSLTREEFLKALAKVSEPDKPDDKGKGDKPK